MPKVLIFGATGTIGGALAESLRRSGNYTVYGIARSPEKALQLEAQEIIPVAGSATDSSNYLALIRDEHIDIVVDAAQALRDATSILRNVRAAGEERLSMANASKTPGTPLAGGKLGFIYTSGNWVHGSTPADKVVNDLDPVAAEHAPQLVNWRVDIEREVLAASDVLDVAVARPGEVYGLNSHLFSFFFNTLHESSQKDPQADVTLLAEADSRVSMIHVDDAASGLHALVDRLPLLSGTGVWPVFDLVSSVESLSALLTHASRALGVQGQVRFGSTKGNVVAAGISTSVIADSGRAKTLLGWSPKHEGMLGRMNLYVRAWKAAKQI